jgi:hypothetical protein
MTTKFRKCGICQIEKLENSDNFRPRKQNNILYFYSVCRVCAQSYSITYYQDHQDERKTYQANFLISNPTYIQNWKTENKSHINKQERSKNKNDINFKLRKNISRSVSNALSKKGFSKNNSSILSYLGYSISQLKYHLENLFEPWMNWDNYGQYNKETWNDHDQSTWFWQLDHIVPHSLFHYTSMDDYAFKQCWSLNNLRPLSAKKNIIDGARRTRHKIRHNKV